MKVSGVFVVIFMGLVTLSSAVKLEVVPDDAVQWVLNNTDRGVNNTLDSFTCSKYDGFAACWHNAEEKRDTLCSDRDCPRQETWSYDHRWGGKCYCCKC